MRQERFNGFSTQMARRSHLVKANKLFDPMDIAFFSLVGIVMRKLLFARLRWE